MSLMQNKKSIFNDSSEGIIRRRILRGIKYACWILGALIILNITLMGINILQNMGGHKGYTMEQILGKPADKASISDIEKLSKSDVMALFYAAPAPEFKSMRGEYKAKLVNVGVMAGFSSISVHHFFGSGHWEGKGFVPVDDESGWGYNLFKTGEGGSGPVIVRERKMKTYTGPSIIDEKNSFHLFYKPFNEGPTKSMHDEVRMINGNLYIGMGFTSISGGSLNPIPFIFFIDDWFVMHRST